jgi:hypothetical protein
MCRRHRRRDWSAPDKTGLAAERPSRYKCWEKLFSTQIETSFSIEQGSRDDCREERHEHAQDVRRPRRYAGRLVGFR